MLAENKHMRLMKGIFGKVYLDPKKRKSPQACDGCDALVPPGRRVYRIGINAVCGPCGRLAAQKMEHLIGLYEATGGPIEGEDKDLFSECDPAADADLG